MQGDDFARNLHYLCGFHPSISEICRRLPMNRQQFNKYLGGRNRPSRRNLRRICAFFGIGEGDLFLPHDRFTERFERHRGAGGEPSRMGAFVDGLLSSEASSNDKLKRYLGYYFTHYCSPSFPGGVRRSLARFYQDGDGQTYSKTLDPTWFHGQARTRRPGQPVVKFQGIVFFNSERIFIVEQESQMKTFVSETILYPSYRASFDLLSGITVSVAGASTRDPYASRIVFSYLGEEIDHRATLRRCGVFEPDDPEIDDAVRRLLDSPVGEGAALLRVAAP